MNAETLAELFHSTYERLAPGFGYTTRPETAVSWEDIPAENANKRLMIAVAGEVLPACESDAAKTYHDLLVDLDAYLRDSAPYTYVDGTRGKPLREHALQQGDQGEQPSATD